MGLDSIEAFDEWEEFALFASHYSVVTASTFEQESSPKSNESRPCSDLQKASLKLVAYHQFLLGVTGDSLLRCQIVIDL